MHEVGHNLGVGHSGEGPEGEYEDRSCVMGVSFLERDSPQECFNGWRNWSLDWFVNQQVTVDPVQNGPWVGNLAAFVDYTDIAYGDYAIINVRDLYLQYNLAKKHNQQVEEKANQVTVVKAGYTRGDVSIMLDGLDMESPSFTYENQGVTIIVEVCEPGSYGEVDYMRMSVHTSYQISACASTLATQTPRPIPSPTPSSTAQQTPAPTYQPIPLTTLSPTVDTGFLTDTTTTTSTEGTVLRRPPGSIWD
jgi:hypothetical protein